ncbi:MAG: BMP family ABC transporter substrate-binding protein, partial [Candidatus Planktophila sp.]
MRRSRMLVSLIALSFVLSACGSSSSDSGSGSNAQGQEGALAPYDAAKAGGTLTLVAKGAAGTLDP